MVGFLRSLLAVEFGAGGSEHAKTFGIGDGFQQSLPQFLLAAIFRKQQHIKASVRCR